MGGWDIYKNRINIHGKTKRDASKIREVRFINNKLPDSLSYHAVDIYPSQYSYNIFSQECIDKKYSQNVAIINSDNLSEKYIYSMPNEDIQLGSLIFWMENYWIVYERDTNQTLYTKAKLLQCNHLLKWIAGGIVIEQWSVVEDGTKYMSGELEDRNFVTTRGDSRISVQLSKNKYTTNLNRENRFLIDDEDSPHKLSYILSKPLKKGFTYNGTGTFKFVLQEVTSTEFDNHELGIADYYKYFPKTDGNDVRESDKNERKVWL